MMNKESDRLAFAGIFLFLGIVFVYDGFLDLSIKRVSAIIGVIFIGIGVLISKFPELKKKKK